MAHDILGFLRPRSPSLSRPALERRGPAPPLGQAGEEYFLKPASPNVEVESYGRPDRAGAGAHESSRAMLSLAVGAVNAA